MKSSVRKFARRQSNSTTQGSAVLQFKKKHNANSSNNSNPVLTAEETLVVTLLYNIENIQTQQPRTDIRSMMPIPTF